MELQPSAFAQGREIYLERMGDPRTWTGDWRKCPNGRYLKGEAQRQVNEQLQLHHRLIVALSIRQMPSKVIGAVFGVSREAVDRRLRPLGLKNPPGQVGRPRTRNQ